MISVPKPLASLSSGLLARKGQARPAMRRQTTLAEAGDDLGWNDMGEPAPLPPVLAEREELAEALDAVTEPEPRSATGRKAAFTLRLDADRHLRLRLAAATRRISAQRLVTEALDRFLNTTSGPEVSGVDVPGAATERLGDGS